MTRRSRMENLIARVTDAEIFELVYADLRRLAAVVGPREVDPDDLVQDALERTLRRHRLVDLDHPKAYLARVILNLASNQRRRLGRARRAATRLGGDEAVTTAYPSDLAELLRLPPRQRAMLFLREVEGYTYAEVAEQLGMTEPAVARASARARARLSGELREEMR